MCVCVCFTLFLSRWLCFDARSEQSRCRRAHEVSRRRCSRAREAFANISSLKTNMFTTKRRATCKKKPHEQVQKSRSGQTIFAGAGKSRAYFRAARKDNSRRLIRNVGPDDGASRSRSRVSRDVRGRTIIPSLSSRPAGKRGDCRPRSKLAVTIALTTRRLSRTRDDRQE